MRNSRRRFLQGLGLGAGAATLGPICERLLGRALGQPMGPRKRLVIMSVYMLEPLNYTPEEVRDTDHKQAIAPFVPSAWPAMFDPIGHYLPQSVFVDNLRMALRNGTQHRAGTCALSCLNPAEDKPETQGAPAGGPTIDQYIASRLRSPAPHRSLLWGLTGGRTDRGDRIGGGVFARGERQNVEHFAHAGEMFSFLFPDTEGGAADTQRSSPFRPLRDRLLADLDRAMSRLAPEERLGLESYEAQLVDLDRRHEALAAIRCDSPPAAPGEDIRDAQAHLESMMAQSMLALTCGMTDVVGITIGTADDHNKHQPNYRYVVENSSDPRSIEENRAKYYGHGGSTAENQPYRLEAKRNYHRLHLRELAGLLDRLARTPEDDGSTMLDHTAVLYVTGNEAQNFTHHAQDSRNARWPGLLLAGQRTGFRTGGRFLRYPRGREGAEHRYLGELYRTLAQGLGVDPSDFGRSGDTNTGPRLHLEELLG